MCRMDDKVLVLWHTEVGFPSLINCIVGSLLVLDGASAHAQMFETLKNYVKEQVGPKLRIGTIMENKTMA